MPHRELNDANKIAVKYAISLGKAMALAQNFENNCKFVHMTFTLEDALEKRLIHRLEEFDSFSSKLLSRLTLGVSLNRLGQLSPFICEGDIEVLKIGKDARNYIAHEAAHPLLFGNNIAEYLKETLAGYVEAVRALVKADALIATWSCGVQEKVWPLSTFVENYIRDVSTCILDDIVNLPCFRHLYVR